ncbi:MAG: guanylate kinase [Geminocystis sp.]|nr:guanylate kinase [Geminocystis sp.]HIK38651.1 guanylate kinase [Geminocystis sp. M7585_C2015_104]MCS7147615.1 guanylate kinase [Geminocystis sp.]MCX8078018.1 guanylate kinase [Geminocystis sp.]MDW8115308.1 guanylate kinase [Geminocystis sp.]
MDNNSGQSQGKLVVITGPSGVGKGTIIKRLLAKHPHFFLSISATTRNPRQGEVNGRDYYFLSRQEFETLIRQSQFLEWAEYNGNYYGTPCQPVKEQIAKGKTVILEIEVQGARQVKKTFPSAVRIFIMPPSLEELERRLRQRGTDSEDSITKRLQQAKTELAASGEFDYQIVNAQLEDTISQIEAIILKHRYSPC